MTEKKMFQIDFNTFTRYHSPVHCAVGVKKELDHDPRRHRQRQKKTKRESSLLFLNSFTDYNCMISRKKFTK